MLSNVEGNYGNLHYPEENSIRGKRVVILGSVPGTGSTTAALLAEQGAKVFLAAKDQADLKSVLVETLLAGNIDGAAADLSSAEGVSSFFKLAKERLEYIDVVVDFLGIETGHTAELEKTRWLCTREAITHMQEQGKGQIINVGTVPAAGLENLPAIPVTGRLARGESSLSGAGAALRRKAKKMGIRITRIQAGAPAARNPESAAALLGAGDIARCVYESLIRPFSADVIYLRGHFAG